MRADWDILCTTMTHEFGHLLGHCTTTAPGSVMAPLFTDYSSVPADLQDEPARAASRAAASG